MSLHMMNVCTMIEISYLNNNKKNSNLKLDICLQDMKPRVTAKCLSLLSARLRDYLCSSIRIGEATVEICVKVSNMMTTDTVFV